MKTERRDTMRRNGGFTMVELLAVMAIIVILMGIIVGGAGYAQRKSAEAKTRQIFEEVRSGIEEFKSDYGYVPPSTTTAMDATKWYYWYRGWGDRGLDTRDAKTELWEGGSETKRRPGITNLVYFLYDRQVERGKDPYISEELISEYEDYNIPHPDGDMVLDIRVVEDAWGYPLVYYAEGDTFNPNNTKMKNPGRLTYDLYSPGPKPKDHADDISNWDG